MAAITTRTREFDFGSYVSKIVARVDGQLQGWLGLLRHQFLPALAVAGARSPSQAISRPAIGLKRVAGTVTDGFEPMCSNDTRSRRLGPVTS